MSPRKLTAVDSSGISGISGISGFKIKEVDRGIFKPSIDEHFVVSDRNGQFLDSVTRLSEMSPQNLVFTGPQGCGKTELAVWLAAKYDRPCIVMNCPTVRENKDWFGYRDAKDGSVFWHKSDFVRATEAGNVVVVLDEFNRLHSSLHNALYPLLDARRSSWVEDLGEMVQVGKGTIFVATMNLGYLHTGTHTMDSAMNDRFVYRVDLDFPTADVEAAILRNKTGIDADTAERLARFARDVRRKTVGVGATLQQAVSVRQLLGTSMLMREFQRSGRPTVQAFEFTVLPYYSKEGGRDSEQAQVLQLVQGIFGSEGLEIAVAS